MKELKELVFSTRGAISVISRSPSPNPQGWGRVNPSLRARTMCARTTGRGGAAQRRRRCENRPCMPPPSASVRARGCRVRKMPKMTSAQIMVRDVAMECPEAVSVVASSPAARDTAQFVPPIDCVQCAPGRLWTARRAEPESHCGAGLGRVWSPVPPIAPMRTRWSRPGPARRGGGRTVPSRERVGGGPRRPRVVTRLSSN